MESFNHFGDIADALEDGIEELVEETAEDLQANTQMEIVGEGLVDSGFLHDSVYKKTNAGSDYLGGDKALPEIGDEPDESTGYVAVAAVYGAIQNYGGRGIPPHPYWEPAVEHTKLTMQHRAQILADELEAAAG